jgi:hypothetical protein
VKFLRRTSSEADESAIEVAEPIENTPKGYTPAKGRPTPKRRDAEARRRGPVAPAPTTMREARQRGKLGKEDRRKAAAARREGMAAGDDRYLLPRDKGPVRSYVRDVIDSRRNLLGLFMPMALLIFIALLVPVRTLQLDITLLCTLVLVAMAIEGVFLGRMAVKRVRAKFPDATDRSFGLGWYAFVRGTQIRKLRMPKPKVKPGDKI